MNTKDICPFCGSKSASVHPDYDRDTVFIECEVCGRVKYGLSAIKTIKECKNEIATYLFYHKNKYKDYRSFYYIGTSKEDVADYEWAHTITKDEVLNFYNCSFSERIDQILFFVAKRSLYIGQSIELNYQELFSLLFIKRYDKNGNALETHEIDVQLKAYKDYFLTQNYMKLYLDYESTCQVWLLVDGWQRADELQKYNPDSKSVFIAMSFAKEMNSIREAIKEAIIECGFTPRIMDEIEHNHQIVPEMLYEIRQAKFVIAELTGHNNGAYFEAGYALGQGKEVIQLCKEDTFGKDGHFDVKQVNTVLWKDEEDLKDRLVKRMKATIE